MLNTKTRKNNPILFDVNRVNDAITSIIDTLGDNDTDEQEIKACIEILTAAKRLMKSYSGKILNQPFKRKNAQYIPKFSDQDINPIIVFSQMLGEIIDNRTFVEILKNENQTFDQDVLDELQLCFSDAEENLLELIEGSSESLLLQRETDIGTMLQQNNSDNETIVETALAKGLKNLLAMKEPTLEEFERGAEFNDGATQFSEQQREKREAEDLLDELNIEKMIDDSLRKQGIEPDKRKH